MINNVVLIGRLTRDPEMRVSQNNVAVTNFNLAVNRPFTNKGGEQQADFINVITFRKIAENVNQYLQKGSLCGIDGRIQTRNYENKEGRRVYVVEVVAESVQFLEPKNSNNRTDHRNSYPPADQYPAAYDVPPKRENRNQQGIEPNPFEGDAHFDESDLPY